MADFDSTSIRLSYAAEKVLDCDVMVIKREYWSRLVRSDGMPTLLNDAPKPVEKVMKEAMVVAVVASGECNPDPGFDIVRYDPKDAPFIFNIDHYRVCENFGSHPEFETICLKADVKKSTELTSCLSEYVFIVKNEPSDTSDHWSKQLPNRIYIARHKTSS